MRITLATTTLAEILEMSTRIIAKSSTLPILQNIYLHVNNNELTVKATDMEKFIHMTLPLDKAEDGGITVDAKTLHDIIKVIEDDNVELSVNNSTDMLTIQSVKDSFTIKGIPTGEFVALPELTPTHTSTIPVQDLVHGIGKVEFAVLEKIRNFVSTHSYGIYCAHLLGLFYLAKIGIHFHILQPFFGIPLAGIICLVVCGIVVATLKKIPFGKYIAG